MTTKHTHDCQHPRTRIEGEVYAFSHPLVTREANRAAHGGVTVTVKCTFCGATRQENRNGRHAEATAWVHGRHAT
jgi:hypothetical protein